MATQKKSPMAQMKETHKDKESLVDRILEVLDRGDADKDAFKAKLLGASNKKLLRLFEAAAEVKTKFGGREKAAEALAGLVGKAKDKDYVARLAKYTPPRLLSMLRTVEKKAKTKEKKPAA